MPKNIQAIMEPKSIAVVGATNRPGSVGLAVFRNILNADYQGVLYPVNPKFRSIRSVRAYPTLDSIPDEVDMAIIIVPAEMVPKTLEEAADKKVKGAVVITAGFKEAGGRGVELENRLKEIVKTRDIRLVGPNCLGISNTNPAMKMNASFATKMPRRGNIAFISQSGALCTAVLDYADGQSIGFSKFVSFGNKADVNEIDLLQYLKDDPDTDVICMYIEEISNGREFVETARKITWEARKPILAIKSGRSPEGARAAASHTGSLAGSDMAYDAIFMQSGVQRVEGVNELFHYAIAFAKQPAPKGNRIAIVTNAGGPGIMATDAAIRHNLQLAVLSDETKKKLRESLPPTASVNNPVDVIGDAGYERYEAAIRLTLMDENVDAGIIILSPQAMTDIIETAEIVPRVTKDINKPVLCSFMGIVDVSKGVEYLENHGIPNYTFPEDAVRAMASMVSFGDLLKLEKRAVRRIKADRQAASQLIAEKLGGRDRAMLTEHEVYDILATYGFPTLKRRLIEKPSQIEDAVKEVGFPLVMKISSPDITHKFDAGGVKINIRTIEAACEAYDQIITNAKKFNPNANIQGVLAEKMARRGVEVIIGATRDPKFGPICMFGLGGTFVEVLKDVTFRMAPMWEISAERMLESIKGYKVLRGVRGTPPSDVEALKDCILTLSQMVSDHPEITEMDINPLIVYPEGEGCVVADARMVLSREK